MKPSHDEIVKRIGKNITTLRVRNGLSVPTLAELTGLDERVITRIENGDGAVPVFAVLMIKDALKADNHEIWDVSDPE